MRLDVAEDRTPMGIEITAPAATSAADVDALLVRLGLQPLEDEEWAPLRVA